MPSPLPSALLCRSAWERTYAREVAGRLNQEEQLLDALAATIHRLTNPVDCFAPAEDLPDAFMLRLADNVAGPECHASINRRATQAPLVLRHMQRHCIGATTRHEARCVVILVCPNSNGGAGSLRRVRKHFSHSGAFGSADDHLTMSVIHTQVPDVAKQHTCAPALAKRLRLAVRAQFVRLIATLVPVPVLALARAVGRHIVIRTALAREALVPGPCLNQRTAHAEALAQQITACIRRLNRLVEQPRNDVVLEQPASILAEGRVVPHHIVHCKADKPAKQHVVGDLLYQHAFASNRIQHLQQQHANQFHQGNARVVALRVTLIHACEHRVPTPELKGAKKMCTTICVQTDTNWLQWVTDRHQVIQLRHCELCLGVAVRSAYRFGLGVIHSLVSTFTAPAPMMTARAISTVC